MGLLWGLNPVARNDGGCAAERPPTYADPKIALEYPNAPVYKVREILLSEYTTLAQIKRRYTFDKLAGCYIFDTKNIPY